MAGFAGLMQMIGGGGGGGGVSAADINPYAKAVKALGVQMETTGRGMATANPRISAALSGSAAGEHSAYQRMAQNEYNQALSDNAKGVWGSRGNSKKLFGDSGSITPGAPQAVPGADDPNHGGF